MLPAPIPPDEVRRLAALHRLKILDTPPEERFDRITRLAARVLGVPIANITLIDEVRQWFKSSIGMEGRESPRDISFCGHVVAGEGPLEVTDAMQDARFSDNPFVTGNPGIRFYFGQPLSTLDGSKVGTLCMIDRVPRRFSPEDRAVMADLAGLVESELNAAALGDLIDRLAESERRYRDLFDSSQALVLTLDACGRIVEANPAWRRHFGYSQPFGLDFAQCVREEWRSRWVEMLVAASAGQRCEGFEGWFCTRHGREVYLVGNLTCVQQSGRPAQIHVICEDTTELWRAGEGHRVSAAEAVKARDQRAAVLAHVSHEIRTPLHGILGISRMLLETGLDREQRRLVATLHETAGALRGLLDHVLDFSKAEKGRGELEQIPFSPAGAAASAGALVRPGAAAKGIEVRVAVEPGVPERVSGDPYRLGQVLNNLLGNALKFSERGVIRLGVARVGAGTGEALEFRVKDDGIGIPEAALANLFEAFGQADASVQRRYGGTGLGLAICRELVGQMGGRIGVASEPGHGTEFWFTLPLVEAPEGLEEPGAPMPEARPGRRTRVLVADDNTVNRMVAVHAVASLGHEVREVVDGEQALEVCRSGWPALLLLDCEMPGRSGFEVARVLRSEEAGRHRMPIIALTAHRSREVEERCRAAGMDAVLSKPFEVADLASALAEWIPEPAGSVSGSPGSLPFETEILDQWGAETLDTLIDALVADLDPALDRLEAAARERSAASAADAAHQIAGSAATFGAAAVRTAAAGIEERARAGNVPGAGECMELRATAGALVAGLRERSRARSARG